MRNTAWLVVGFLLLAATASAQDTPKAELSLGYSYFRITEGAAGSNFNGASLSVAGNFNSWLGIVGDTGGYWTKESGITGRVFTYTFGPRISFRSNSRVTPFAQVLVGGARVSVTGGGGGGALNSFALGAGGGLDIKASEHIAIRVVQAEYFFTHFAGSRQNNARVSAGIVFRFGKR